MYEMRDKVERGEMSDGESFCWALDAFGDMHDVIWKNLRTERIARNVKKDLKVKGSEMGSEWTGTDDAGYQKLKDVNFIVGMEESASDSEVDEDQSEEGDSGDEDDGDDEEDIEMYENNEV